MGEHTDESHFILGDVTQEEIKQNKRSRSAKLRIFALGESNE